MPKKAEASCNTYQVNVAKGYLALRTDTAFDSRNEIGELYNGDLVEVMDYTGATGYWYVYSPKYDTFGYVNSDYLNSISSSVSAYDTMWTVIPLFLYGWKKQGSTFTIYAIYVVAIYSLGAWLITDVLPVYCFVSRPSTTASFF